MFMRLACSCYQLSYFCSNPPSMLLLHRFTGHSVATIIVSLHLLNVHVACLISDVTELIDATPSFHIPTHTHTHTHTPTHTHTHSHTHSHSHTHTHTLHKHTPSHTHTHPHLYRSKHAYVKSSQYHFIANTNRYTKDILTRKLWSL